MPPTIDALTIADDPDSWRKAGFSVDPDGTCRVGTVRLELVGTGGGNGRRGILGWSLRDARHVTGGAGLAELDGIPTAASTHPPAEPARHANGTTHIDHLVITSGDGVAAGRALESAGWDLRRLRDVDNQPVPMQQRFFRAGEVILELVSPAEPAADRPTRMFGLALVSADLDATANFLDGRCNPPKEAVQPGRRIATLRTRDLDLSVAIAFMTPDVRPS